VLTPPDQVSFKAIAGAEHARIVRPGEVNALLFAGVDKNKIPVGSKVTVLGLIVASVPDV
jgi:hypothetical protein